MPITIEERMTRLERANAIRSYQADLKRRLADGLATITDVLGDPKADSMRVLQTLLALPAVGPVKANRALRQLGISPTTRLGELSYRQRVGLERRFH